MQFREVLESVSDFLEQAKLRHALAGGVALACYGSPRATADIDMLVEEAARAPGISFLESLGYETLGVYEGFSNHLHQLAGMGRVDLIYLDEPTATTIFSQSRRMTFHSRSILVPRPEHLVAMKVTALRDNPARYYKDMLDLEFLLRLPGIDDAKVRYYFERSGLEAQHEELIRKLGRR